METINQRIKYLRQEWCEMNQVEFAERLGVTNAHISKIEKGKTVPSPALVKLMCKSFGFSERYILKGEGPVTSDEVEEDVDQKMVEATEKISRLLKQDNMIRPMAAELEFLYANIVTLDVNEQETIVEYLNCCHSLFYHLNNFLDFHKQTLTSGQLHLFDYPDDIETLLHNDIESLKIFFKNKSLQF